MQGSFEHLKQLHGSAMSDEAIWELAVEGEDSRGRMFGFGNKSRTCKLNQSLAADDATISEAARSTATSAEAENERFTKSQVAVLIASKIAAERREFAAALAAQERRHKADFDEFKKENQYNKKCLASLFDVTRAPIPDPFVSPSSHLSCISENNKAPFLNSYCLTCSVGGFIEGN